MAGFPIVILAKAGMHPDSLHEESAATRSPRRYFFEMYRLPSI